jgi:peptide/nickel transport system ATP-binding protein
MSVLVTIENLKVNFQSRKGLLGSTIVKALDGVSMNIDRGETLAIVGESGSGKTTLGRVILRLIKHTSGNILFDGSDITKLPESKLQSFRQKAQGVFQDPYSSIDPFMNIAQIVEEPLVIHGRGNKDQRLERIYTALDEVNLSPPVEMAGKYPHMLSGGQRQRVGIARALVMEPDFIVADEPVSMIDASNRAEILYLMRDLQVTRGITFLYITHDIATARHFSDRIAVMYAGRIVEIGPSNAIIDNPLHPYTKALIAAVPEPDPENSFRRRSVISGEPPSNTDPPTGCRFHPRCPVAIAGKCEVVEPVLTLTSMDHSAACHLWNN